MTGNHRETGYQEIDYTFRQATLADVNGIIHVARRAWNTTYSLSVAPHNRQQLLDRSYAPQSLSRAITQPSACFHVATLFGSVVGFSQYVRRSDGAGELARLYVHPDHQRRGVGRGLLLAGIAVLAIAGLSTCHVSVEVDNKQAQDFYRSFGFRPLRQSACFLGDQIIRVVEFQVPLSRLLEEA